METVLQKYREIKTRYDTLVKENKDSIIYYDGGYFQRSLYDQEKKDNNFIPLKSKSRLILNENDKSFFVIKSTGGNYIYTFHNGKLIEKVHLATKANFINSVEDYVDKVSMEDSPTTNKIYVSYYEEDSKGNRETVLYREYKNDILLLERNYKKDFKISKDQMLKKLPENFYNEAVKNILEEQKLKYAQSLGVVSLEEPLNTEIEELIKEKIKEVQKKLKTAIEVKDDFYKELNISKDYDEGNKPIYNLKIRMNHLMSWLLKIDGKTNKVLDIKLINYAE